MAGNAIVSKSSDSQISTVHYWEDGGIRSLAFPNPRAATDFALTNQLRLYPTFEPPAYRPAGLILAQGLTPALIAHQPNRTLAWFVFYRALGKATTAEFPDRAAAAEWARSLGLQLLDAIRPTG
jgi:hypothetical protein